MILTEMVHDARVVRMNAEHLPPTIRKWMGDSIGRWEGDTLVVDTTNFTDKTRFRGSSENLHVVERFTRIDANTLRYQFTVEDPDDVDEAVDRRVRVAGDQRAAVRIRVPRGQLRDGQHPARRAAEGERTKPRRREEVEAVTRPQIRGMLRGPIVFKAFKVAVVQASPVVFDRERTLEKLCSLAGEAARKGARLVLFPEAFVSAYPRGLDFGAVVRNRTDAGRRDFQRYWESSVDVPGPAVDALAKTARTHDIHLVVGVIERDGGTLYCTVLFFAPDGSYLGKHRKVMPTASEARSSGASVTDRRCRSSIRRSANSAR